MRTTVAPPLDAIHPTLAPEVVTTLHRHYRYIGATRLKGPETYHFDKGIVC